MISPEVAWQVALFVMGFGAGFIVHVCFYEFYLRPSLLKGKPL
jgi:hypothetical protein